MSEQKTFRLTQIPLWMWLLPFLLFAATQGIIGLDADILWWDESYMINDARVSTDLRVLVHHIAVTNPWHVPGYFILLNLWGQILQWEWHPITLRIPALYFGLLGIAFTYRLGRDHISPKVGLFAAIILSVSGFMIYFFHEARMYSTCFMLTAFVVWIYLRVVDDRYRIGWRSYLTLLLGFIASLYMHYFMLSVLAGIGIYHLIFAPKNRRWWMVNLMGGIAVASFIPWVYTLLRVLERMSDTTMFDILSPIQLVTTLSTEFSNGVLLFLIILACLSLFAIRRYQGKVRFAVLCVWSSLVIALVTIIVGNEILEVVPFSRLRYLILLFPLFAIITAIGMDEAGVIVSRRYVSLALLSLWIVIAGYYNFTQRAIETMPGYLLFYPMQTVARELRDLHKAGDLVLHLIPRAANYDDYRNVETLYNEFERLATNTQTIDLSQLPRVNPDEAIRDIVSEFHIGDSRQYIWTSYMPDDQSVMDSFSTAIEDITGFVACGQQATRDGAIINQFARHQVCCYSTNGEREPFITYSSAAIEAMASEIEGGNLSFWVSSSADSTLPEDTYSMGIYLLNENGELATQVDTEFPVDNFECNQHNMNLQSLQDGEYGIYLSVYNWQTQQRLVDERGETLPQVGSLRIVDGEYNLLDTP